VRKTCNIDDPEKDPQRNNEVIKKGTTYVIIPANTTCKMNNAILRYFDSDDCKKT